MEAASECLLLFRPEEERLQNSCQLRFTVDLQQEHGRPNGPEVLGSERVTETIPFRQKTEEENLKHK